MLLKSRFSVEPPQTTLDAIWPSVSERLDGPEGRPSNGGGNVPEEGELVFKSSAAMQMLNLPEREQVSSASRPAAAPQGGSSWAWPFSIVVAAAIMTGGFVWYKKMNAPPPAAPAAAPSDPGSISSGGATASTEPKTEPTKLASAQPLEAGAEPGAAGGATAGGAGETPPAAKASEPEAKTKVAGKAAKRAKGAKAEAAGAAPDEKAERPKAEPKEAKPAAKASKKGGDDLDNLIDSAIGPAAATPKKKEAAPAPAPGSDLPDQLNLNQISSAMNKVKPRVAACYDQYQIEGTANVAFTINPDGTVGECSIKGKFFGTDTGTCVVGAVKKARFPKFKGKAMNISSYPFVLQ